MNNEFSAGPRKFKVSKINALKQFHIVRRMTPILSKLAPKLKDLRPLVMTNGEMTEDQKLDAAADFLAPVIEGFSLLSDKDSEYVLMTLLEAVEMHQEQYGNWAKVASGGQLMFQDLDLGVLMQAAGRAFMFNLQGFFAVLPQVL